MKPDDAMSNVAKETIDQTNTIKKQMAVEADAAATADAEPAPDNTIMIDADPNYRPLSEIAAEKTAEIQVDPTVLVDANATEAYQPKKLKSSHRLPILIGLIAGVVLLLGLGIWGIVALLSRDTGGATAEDGVTAFFLAHDGDDRLYAAFNSDGQRLTDFAYATATDFRGGYALVTDSSGTKYAILANTGKLSVPFDEYEEIAQVGANYLAAKEGERQLINGKGERLMYVDNAEDLHGLTVAYSGNDTIIYDNAGTKLGKLSGGMDTSFSVDEFIALTIEGKVYVISTNTGAIRVSFDGEGEYTAVSVSEDQNIIILSEDSAYKKVVWGNNVFDWDAEKRNYIISISFNGYLYAEKNNSTYYMGEDGVIFIQPEAVLYSGYFYIYDHEHYAYIKSNNASENNRTAVIVSGEKQIEFKNASSIKKNASGYVLGINGSGVVVLDKDGKSVFDQTELAKLGSLYSFSGPDQNGNYIKNSTILLNKDLEELSSGGKIELLDDGNYLVVDSKTKGVISADGKELIRSTACIDIVASNGFYSCKVANKLYDLYKNDGSRLLRDYELINIKDNYIEAEQNDKIEYYTLAGQKFYEN